MLIYSNGCSHTEGGYVSKTYDEILAELVFDSTEYVSKKISRIDTDSIKNYDLLISSLKSHQVSGKNILCKNATAGKGNFLIFKETYAFVTKCITNDVNIDYIVIQTSGPNRKYIPTWDGSYDDVTPDDGNNEILFEPWGTLETIQWVYLLQKLFLEHNIPYVFIPYMEYDSESYNISPYTDLIDWDKFTTNPLEGHRNKFRYNIDLVVDVHGHPSIYGNMELVKQCINILKLDVILKSIDNYYGEMEIRESTKKDEFTRMFLKEYSHELRAAGETRLNRLINSFKNKINTK